MKVGIVDEDIVRVRENTDAVAIISQYTQLRRVGRRFQGLCPFHSEKSGSFSVNPELGLYYCFGCSAKGDLITFVREKEQLGFVEAVEWLAHKANITLRYTDTNESVERKRRSYLQDIVGKAVAWYHHRLMHHKDAGFARKYLRERGYAKEQVEEFALGWAPDSWDLLAKSLRLSNADLADSGLGFVNRRGHQQDAFRGRVMFPIFDAQNAAVGFGGRILPALAVDKKVAKYKNSSDSGVYTKSRLLYGLNWAKSDIVQHDEVLVCEGYTDVIAFHQVGVPRAVATCGTSLTEDHVKLLRRFARRVVLAFDADAAGQNAAMKFYEWEKFYEIDVAVADLPAGKDPGELAVHNPVALQKSVEGAIPFLAFRIERCFERSNLDTAESRARIAEETLGMVQEHPDPLVRDQYVMQIASRLRLEPELLRRKMKKGSAIRIQEKRPTDTGSLFVESPELEALKLLVADEESISQFLVPELFVDPIYVESYSLLSTTTSLHEAIEHGAEESKALFHKISVEESTADPVDVSSLLWVSYLERLMDESRAAMEELLSEEKFAEHTWFRMRLEDLRDPAKQAETLVTLSKWITADTEGFG